MQNKRENKEENAMWATGENSEVGLLLLKKTLHAQYFWLRLRKILDRSKLLRNTHKRKNNTFMITTDRNDGYSINKFEIGPGKKTEVHRERLHTFYTFYTSVVVASFV